MAEGDGYGQQRPETSLSEYNAVSFVIERAIAQLHTIKIVQVKAVDTAAKTVTVLPLVQQVDGNNQVTSQGQIYGVPYMALRYGVNAVLADPAEGDIGVLLCADRDISSVKETGEESPPGSLRQYDQSDGIYLGGLLNTTDPEQFVKFADAGMELHDKNGNILVSKSTGWEFTGPVKFNDTVTAAADINSSGTVTGATDVKVGAISLKTHTHSYTRPSSGGVAAITGQPQ